MAVVDHEAAWHEFRRRLREPAANGQPRSSWGRPHLLELLDELEVKHLIDESADRAILRRFAGGLVDTFLGLLPRSRSTDDPLELDDPSRTSRAMAGGELQPMTGGHDGSQHHAPAHAGR